RDGTRASSPGRRCMNAGTRSIAHPPSSDALGLNKPPCTLPLRVAREKREEAGFLASRDARTWALCMSTRSVRQRVHACQMPDRSGTESCGRQGPSLADESLMETSEHRNIGGSSLEQAVVSRADRSRAAHQSSQQGRCSILQGPTSLRPHEPCSKRWQGNSGRTIWSHSHLTMSCVQVVDDGAEVCANCGKQGSDTVKLKNCTSCRLVKYCGVDCQRAHRKQHKRACKQRAAELKDEQLYSQGHERPEGDFCTICTLPIPVPMDEHATLNLCCMKQICNGCNVAAQKRGMHDCPFCRTPLPKNDADTLAMIQARVAKKDPAAIYFLGNDYSDGKCGLQKDMQKAVELWTEAAELGSIKALHNLGLAHVTGRGAKQDKAKGINFWSKAAMQGDAFARHNLGFYERKEGNHERAVRHYLISAKMGYEHSLESIKETFMAGHATKEQYAEALKGYQDAVEETKSYERDEAKRLGY
ncbi:hypothetical protein THAOC_37392, partial [Thalassiosira oceanica]